MTQFVRFAGCNLRCPGWPCDTQHAIEPNLYIGKYIGTNAEELIDLIEEMEDTTGAKNVAITGGEPFLQNHLELDDVLYGLVQDNFTVEVFTNGTIDIPGRWLTDAQINMDWKLSGSGEGQKAPDTRLRNARVLKNTDMVKFVIKDMDDFSEALHVSETLARMSAAQLWAGVAFGEMTEADLVAKIIEYRVPWKLNVQVHKYVWDAERKLV